MANKGKELLKQQEQLGIQADRMGEITPVISSLGKTINSTLAQEIHDYGRVPNPNLIDADDVSRVIGLLNKFRFSVKDLDYEAVIRNWEAMGHLVSIRREENAEKMSRHIRTTEGERVFNFKRFVRNNLPEIQIKNVDGELAVSSYKKGIKGLLTNEAQLWLMNTGKKKYRGIIDDGIIMSPKWIRIYNQVGFGDPRVRQEISWNNAGELDISYDSPPIFNPVNALKRLGGNPEPVAPVGVLKIFSLQGQDTEGNIPELANVLVKDPVAWVNVFNQLKQAMCNKTEPNLLREELYLQHFWRYGLEDIVNSREFRQFLPDCVIADLQKIRREKSTLDAQIGIQRRPNFWGRK